MNAMTADTLGLGFVFSKTASLVGIDLDKCRDATSGVLEPWAQDIVTALNSYTEVSPSGRGVHIFVSGELPLGRRKKDRIEVYQHGRFFTVTGRHLEGTPLSVEPRGGELIKFHTRYLADPPTPERSAVTKANVMPSLSDEAILEKCQSAKNAAKFAALWRGDWQGYSSHSEADLALLGILKFYSPDPAQLDRLFRRSGLMRPKWDDRHGDQTYGSLSISAALSHVQDTYSPSMHHGSDADEPDAFPRLIPLDEVRLPDLSADTFPAPLGPMIEAVARATETPSELPALMGLATVAASCQRVFEVEMEPGYIEPLSIWAVPALQSGNRKTAVHTLMTAPLRKKEWALCEEAKAQRATIESERTTIEAQVKGLRSRLSNTEDIGDIEDIKRKITTLETTMPELPPLPSLWAQDVTPEKLGIMMAENGERLAILSDEGGIFDMFTGRYNNGIPNLDTCLQGHSCSPVKVNRGSRGEVHMHRPTLTIGLSPQPSVLRDLSEKSVLRDRGFLARILFALPTSRLGYRTLETQPIRPEIETAYHRMIEGLLNFQPPTTEEGHVVAYRIKPSAQAYQEWKDFQRAVERDMQPGKQYEHMTDWAGKLPGAAARVAAHFHCVKHAHEQPHALTIALETMQQALGVLAVLSQHALAVFDLIGADPALDGARKVWRWIDQERRRQFSGHDCFERLRGTFKRMANLEPAFAVLCERGYLMEPRQEKKVGRPSRQFIVNPILTEGWT
jgi:hypothetical protein